MQAAAGLDAGLFVSREHPFILAQCASLPLALIQIQDPPGFERKIRIPGKDPTAMLPGTNGVLMEPPPKRRGAPVGQPDHFGKRVQSVHPSSSGKAGPDGWREVRRPVL